MRPHPKIRKTVKWGGAAASVLLAVVWVGSGQWEASWNDRNGIGLGVVRGSLNASDFSRVPDNPDRGWVIRHSTLPRDWWVCGYFQASGCWNLYIPLWLPIGLTLVPTAAAWWLDRRTRRWALIGACTNCGYNRAGLAAEAVCPECGAGASPSAKKQAKEARAPSPSDPH